MRVIARSAVFGSITVLLVVTHTKWTFDREYVNVGREAKLLLLTEIGATAAPLAARGVVSRLQSENI